MVRQILRLDFGGKIRVNIFQFTPKGVNTSCKGVEALKSLKSLRLIKGTSG